MMVSGLQILGAKHAEAKNSRFLDCAPSIAPGIALRASLSLDSHAMRTLTHTFRYWFRRPVTIRIFAPGGELSDTIDSPAPWRVALDALFRRLSARLRRFQRNPVGDTAPEQNAVRIDSRGVCGGGEL